MESGCVLLTAGGGCGKTTAVELALEESPAPVAWISCSEAERVAGVLLMRIVDSIAAAVPGASDALAERLAMAPERIDALAATNELVAELSRLLVEPLVVVIDDAEYLDGTEESMRLVGALIRAEVPPLHVAVASRRPLDLRVAKPRAAGKLIELTAADIAFDAEECAELLRIRAGLDPTSDQVDEVMSATEGWPLGIALAVGLVGRSQPGAESDAAFGALGSAPDMRSYLAEELVDSLESELREGAVASSVARVVTPEVRRALGLSDEFGDRVERAGLLVRRMDGEGGGFTYHPLLREFLLARLREDPDEWRRLSAAVAPAVAGDGDAIAGIEHWLDAQSWPEAAAAIEAEGLALLRTSPGLVQHWLSRLPPDYRAQPMMRSLEGQIEWLGGHNSIAADALRDAVRGFRERPNAPADWLTRSVLLDCLFATCEVDDVELVVEGWDHPDAAPAGGLAPAAAMYAACTLAAFSRFEESDRLAAAASAHPQADLLAPFEALRRFLGEYTEGDLDRVCEGLEEAAREMERFDPLNRRHHVLGALAVTLADRGYPDEALEQWLKIQENVRSGIAQGLGDGTHGWCAMLHAQAGRLAEAEAELARYRAEETGVRSYIRGLAPAAVASLRGDAPATVTAADEALAVVADGPILFRFWVAAELVPALAGVGSVDRAREVLDGTLAAVEDSLPDPRGRFPRGRLLALRAWLADIQGDAEGADDDLRRFWKEAGESRHHTLRSEWSRLRPVVWGAVERRAIDPADAMEALSRAFPDGRQLVPFLDHPLAAARTAALGPAVRSGDREALVRLQRLSDDPDPELASEASLAVDRLATSLPPLRFEMLGQFAVNRGSWRAGESDWRRPIDTRVVRFLLVQEGEPVPEDLIFEALWPGKPPDSARRGLQVAVSGVRSVLDLPGAERSAIESGDHAYRLVLGERDSVDAGEFQAAAEIALGASGAQRRALLERARGMWGGEPLPEEVYSDWATSYRERLIDRYIAVLTALVELHGRAGEHTDAAAIARELVDLDSLNEGGHRALIVAYARAGRTGHALRQYLECRRALVEQLGVEPAQETSRLQARILAGEAV